jgi:hypothetical protein
VRARGTVLLIAEHVYAAAEPLYTVMKHRVRESQIPVRDARPPFAAVERLFPCAERGNLIVQPLCASAQSREKSPCAALAVGKRLTVPTRVRKTRPWLRRHGRIERLDDCVCHHHVRKLSEAESHRCLSVAALHL